MHFFSENWEIQNQRDLIFWSFWEVKFQIKIWKKFIRCKFFFNNFCYISMEQKPFKMAFGFHKVETKQNKFSEGSHLCNFTWQACNSSLSTLTSLTNHNASFFLIMPFLLIVSACICIHDNNWIDWFRSKAAWFSLCPVLKEEASVHQRSIK